MVLWIMVIILSIIILMLYLRLFFLRHELVRISDDLKEMNEHDKYKLVTVNTGEKSINLLSSEINKRLEYELQNQRKAAEMEHSLRDAMAGISHDLRTPLTSVLGFVQLLKNRELDENTRLEYLEIIKSRAVSLQALINSLFEFSSITSAEYSLELEQIDLTSLLINILASYYDNFNEKNITPIIDVPDEKIIVPANTIAVQRIIENLISNVLKHNVHDAAFTLKKQGQAAVLTVSNTVSDLKQEDLERLFDRFFTPDKARTKGNTGLGLAIASELMNKMNGKINAELIDNKLYISCEWEIKKDERNQGIDHRR